MVLVMLSRACSSVAALMLQCCCCAVCEAAGDNGLSSGWAADALMNNTVLHKHDQGQRAVEGVESLEVTVQQQQLDHDALERAPFL
jgi:hypothetical protein